MVRSIRDMFAGGRHRLHAATTRVTFMSNLSVIVYRSRALFAPTDVDLFYLIAHARERNKALGLSGVILYDRGHFFQWLEGANKALGAVWTSIRGDTRHSDVRVLADQEIPVRLFEGWSMRLAHRQHEHDGISEGFVVTSAAVLDDLHLNPGKVPNILASFSKLGGSFTTANV